MAATENITQQIANWSFLLIYFHIYFLVLIRLFTTVECIVNLRARAILSESKYYEKSVFVNALKNCMKLNTRFSVSWTLILLTCLSAALYTIIIQCITAYSSNQQHLSHHHHQQRQQQHQSLLPAVTICNLNPYRWEIPVRCLTCHVLHNKCNVSAKQQSIIEIHPTLFTSQFSSFLKEWQEWKFAELCDFIYYSIEVYSTKKDHALDISQTVAT